MFGILAKSFMTATRNRAADRVQSRDDLPRLRLIDRDMRVGHSWRASRRA